MRSSCNGSVQSYGSVSCTRGETGHSLITNIAIKSDEDISNNNNNTQQQQTFKMPRKNNFGIIVSSNSRGTTTLSGSASIKPIKSNFGIIVSSNSIEKGVLSDKKSEEIHFFST